MVDIKDHNTAFGRGGLMMEHGTSSFSGYGLAREIPCSFKQLHAAVITPVTAPTNIVSFQCDLSTEDSGGAGTVTVNRICRDHTASFMLDADDFDAGDADLVSTPLLIAQHPMLLKQVEWYHGTGWIFGSPSLQLGNTTTAAAYLTGALTITNGATSTFTTFTEDEVADGAVLIASTIGAMGASGTSTSTQTVTGTDSGTMTTTATRTGSPTATATGTQTGTATVTGTQTGTATVTGTLSGTMTQTGTGILQSATPTRSRSASGSPSHSRSASGSPSHSRSVSGSPTPTGSKSGSPSHSRSESGSPSPTRSASASPSGADGRPDDVALTILYWTPTNNMVFSYILYGTY